MGGSGLLCRKSLRGRLGAVCVHLCAGPVSGLLEDCDSPGGIPENPGLLRRQQHPASVQGPEGTLSTLTESDFRQLMEKS